MKISAILPVFNAGKRVEKNSESVEGS